ncbi:MAG TPA: glycogen debranching enzyme N-terminal domain-containing protein, partial [Geobacteraceae bacterium]|nr:glycogen debranching enzyme N-terminal domain-containing protein [Geobacteraceae bacterium]
MPHPSIEDVQRLDFREAMKLEWLDANGTGGYASSTIFSCHTRKYHGLLVTNLRDPAGRFVLLSKFEDS